MLQENGTLKILGQMIDRKNAVATQFYLATGKTSGPTRNRIARHLVLRSSDGRPDIVTRVPDSWSDDHLLILINEIISCRAGLAWRGEAVIVHHRASDDRVGCTGMDEDLFEDEAQQHDLPGPIA
jgi:ABC-type antimicrobial peptide transport system permease subunit